MSFYNTGVGKNLLKRFWPLWLLYFLVLVVELPMMISGTGFEQWRNPAEISQDILQSGVNMAQLSPFACVIVVMAMFSHLYNSRSCGMMASLPVRRETMFMTACLTGLVPMLLLDVACFGITALLYAGSEYVKLSALGTWLAAVVLANVAFYAMAVFCAMLTGNIVVLPLVYAMLNAAAFVVEGVVTSLLGLFLYGFVSGPSVLLPFSPFAKLYGVLRVTPVYEMKDGVLERVASGYQIGEMNWLGIYCAAGVVLMIAAGLLYRRRRMETAGDTVAVQVLKPIFKYCMAFGTAIVLSCFVCDMFSSLSGTAAAALAIAMLVVGAYVGYIIAEMIVQKTLSVFHGIWKGPTVCAAILVAAGLLCEFDVAGYETRVPEADEVRSIMCPMTSESIKEKETIEDFIELHRHIIAGKQRNEKGFDNSTRLDVSYMLNDGSVLDRSYEIDNTIAAAEDADSDIARWEAIMNSDEVRGYRTSFDDIPLTRETLDECRIRSYAVDSEGRYQDKEVTLTAEQTLELYNECILPDAKDGNLGDYFAVNTDEYYDIKTNTSIYIGAFDKDRPETEGGRYNSIDYTVQVNSARCLKWIEENTDLEPLALSIADPPEREGDARDTKA